MKIDELKKAIRGLVREEVRKAVAEEVSKVMGKVLVEMVKEIKSNDAQRLTEGVEEEIPEIIHTKNPKYNSVLAETARHSKPLQRTRDLTSGLAELMDGGFDRIGQNENVGIETQEPATNLGFLKQMVNSSPVPQQQSVLDSGAEIPDVLKGVFKKDFRAVMRKMDEQKRGGGGGFINPGTIMGG